MEPSDLLTDAFARVRGDVLRIVEGLSAEALAYRADPEANPIAWLICHAIRVEDDHISELAGSEQAWIVDGWQRRFDLPLASGDTGFGHSPEQVAAVRIDDSQLLVAYNEAVAARTAAYLQTVDATELERIIDDRWDPPVSVGVRLVSVLHDTFSHLGQAAYVRGMIERRASRRGE